LVDGTVKKFERVMRNLMLTDRDYINKSSRAFVAHIRSYKEHKLSNILKFSSMDPVSDARSFFLFKFPVMREFKDMTVTPEQLSTPEELQKFEKVEYLNKNQQEMIKKKIEEAIENRRRLLT
jgi:ATP-dependent RNA helicase DDX55/SPB4